MERPRLRRRGMTDLLMAYIRREHHSQRLMRARPVLEVGFLHHTSLQDRRVQSASGNRRADR